MNSQTIADMAPASQGIRELKHVHFWVADGNQKWAIFYFNLPSRNHIHIAKYRFYIRDDWYKNLGGSMVLAREMISSICRPHLKKVCA